MSERYIKLTSEFLYYFVCPCLLVYFLLIDMGVFSGSLPILFIFALAIILGVGFILLYKKKNSQYSFNVNKLYEKVMCILVLLELAYSFSK